MKKSNFITLVKKELSLNYLISPLGFIFSALFSAVSLWLFFQDFFLIGQARLQSLFNLFPFLFLFFLPAITMNLFSIEKKNNTWEILLTLPVNEIQIVLSKFLVALGFAFFTVLLTLPAAFAVIYLGQPDWGVIISAYLGTLLLIASYISSGLFFSSLTTNPIIAFISSAVFLLINFFLGQQMLMNRLPSLISNIVSAVSLNYHYQNLIAGNFLIDSLVLFISWIFLFLWLTVIILKSRDY